MFFCSFSNESNLAGVQTGDKILIDTNTIKSEAVLAYLECELRHKYNGQTIAKGVQTRCIPSPLEHFTS